MPLSDHVIKPAYIYRPEQVIRRVVRRQASEGDVRVVLPWGLPTIVSGGDVLGRGIIRRNVHELAITEAMWRLTDRNDIALDVGANSGYFTSLLAYRAAEVYAFEPHPALAARLGSVIAAWPAEYRDKVRLETAAVSDRSGTAQLSLPQGFGNNEGIASLAPTEAAQATLDVRTLTLDEVVAGRRVGVMKIDIEGHELVALRGAAELLCSGALRDVFFEEHEPLPTPVSALLSDHGYTIFGLRERLRGVQLTDPSVPQPRWDAATYLATRDPDRARARVRLNGWNSLRPRGLIAD